MIIKYKEKIMENTWDTGKFKINKLYEMIETGEIVSPEFQRGFVWKDKQVSDFMETLKKGLPFGSILLYKNRDKKYLIIDGLQRVTAVYKFTLEPTRYLETKDIDKNIIMNILSTYKIEGDIDNNCNFIIQELVDWVKEKYKTIKDVPTINCARFVNDILIPKYSELNNHAFEVGDMIQPMFDSYREICDDIQSKEIPAIIMEGSEKYLPEVFEKINSEGTKLSKYDIYKAGWGAEKYSINHKNLQEIIKANQSKYEKMNYGKIHISNYNSDDFGKEKKLSAFEIAFGFGKMISNKWPDLFKSNDEETIINGEGFSLINCCLCNKNSNLKNMHTELKEKVGHENINDFLLKILECIEYVDDILGKYNRFKGNSQKSKKYTPKHSEFQIISIIASVFINKYVTLKIDDEENITSATFHLSAVNESWKKNEKSFINNVAKIYILEILSGRWAGTGDKNMDMVITNNDYYMRNVSKEEFKQGIKSWYDSTNRMRNEIAKVANPKNEELILLAVLYLFIFNAAENMDSSKYDIEHLATKKIMKDKLNEFNGELKLPISSFGNLCYLPQFANRSKGENTIYDDTSYLSKCGISIDELEERYSFTKEDDLVWLKKDLSIDEFKKQYFKFIDTRFNRMLEMIMKNFAKI